MMLPVLVLSLLLSMASAQMDDTWCNCEEKGKPTHAADIIKEAANILLVEVLVTDPPPTLRKGRSGPGLRMEYKAKVLKVIKGCLSPAEVDIKQLVFNKCPPPTLQGQFYISGAMGSKKKRAGGGGGRENIFYLDPCGLALSEETPIKKALDFLGNSCSDCAPAQPCAPCMNNGRVSPLQQCDDVCAASSCDEEGGKCLVSMCGPVCFATWISNHTAPKVLCPSGLPSGAISEGIRNLQARERLLIKAQEAYKLGRVSTGNDLLADVVKLSAGGEKFRVPSTTSTTEEPETEAPQPRKPIGLQGLIQVAKENPGVGHRLDSYRRMASEVRGEPFQPMFDNQSRQRRVAKRVASFARRLKERLSRSRRRRRRRQNSSRTSRRRRTRRRGKNSRRRRGKSTRRRRRGKGKRGKRGKSSGNRRRRRGKSSSRRRRRGKSSSRRRRRRGGKRSSSRGKQSRR